MALFWLKCASSFVEELYHTAVQVGNMQDFNVQQVAEQPESKAQHSFPVATIFDVVQQAPRLLEVLTPEGVKALTATCTQFRQDFRSSVTSIQMTNDQDTAMLCADKWPNLVMVVISTTIALSEELHEDRLRSNLSDIGWSTIVRLQLEQHPDSPANWRSGGQQSVALIVSTSHESSPDMDTKAHGSALARFATKWEAKTQSMYMNLDSDSVRIDPLKHLQMSKRPCLEFITCHGKYGNALPISCFLGESSSKVQSAVMSDCSLGAGAVQSLVTRCPHLYCLTLIACKLEAAALKSGSFLVTYELGPEPQSAGLVGCPVIEQLPLASIAMAGS